MVLFENCDWWCFGAHFGNIFNHLQDATMYETQDRFLIPFCESRVQMRNLWQQRREIGRWLLHCRCQKCDHQVALPLNNVTMRRSTSLCVIKLICLSTKLTYLVPQRQMALEAQGEGEGAMIQGSRSGRGVIHAPGLAEQQVLREIRESIPSIKIFSECGWKADYYCSGSKTDKELWGEWKYFLNLDSLILSGD